MLYEFHTTTTTAVRNSPMNKHTVTCAYDCMYLGVNLVYRGHTHCMYLGVNLVYRGHTLYVPGCLPSVQGTHTLYVPGC